ncbi:protein of unknown function [Pseudodesulfovibrio piezophilus C1TLV30]|uniref:Uncharacterized protein n=1 Tax=Pseudodesulfovibrio piezophilus (strain DSM 21447 / JCM 15486 / C1TLV30) TaxID=1322246 RepID=M1WKB8_PSEP2|nr:protein of unknown function [Pseudodesulfovibrio piezophilus C1TLV30]
MHKVIRTVIRLSTCGVPVESNGAYRRGVEQLVARRAHNPKARGSSPLPATRIPFELEPF